MNCSLISADCGTHTKIVIVALLASILVVWIGINARISGGVAPSTNRTAELTPRRTTGEVAESRRGRLGQELYAVHDCR